MDWEPSIGQIAAVANDTVRKKKLCAKWITEKELARKKKEKLCFRYSGSGYEIQNCLYLPAKRSTAPAKAGNKEKAIKVVAVNDKKAARLQIEEVSDSEPVSAFNSENE